MARRGEIARSIMLFVGDLPLAGGERRAVLGVSGPLVGLNYTNIIKFYETLHAVRKPVNQVLVNDI